MSTKHTPGPWNVRDDGMSYACPIIDAPSVGKGYFASIATVTQRDPHPQHGGGVSMATAEANARLIAAAPDLLEALQDMVRVFDCGLPAQCIGRTICDNSIAVIKKARGES